MYAYQIAHRLSYLSAHIRHQSWMTAQCQITNSALYAPWWTMAHTEGHLDPYLISRRWTKRVSWKHREDPFISYCWTNPALMVQHWHEWLQPKLETCVPKKLHIDHHCLAGLLQQPPTGVITKEQEHKLAQLKADVERMSEEDLAEYQHNLFAGRSTEKIFKHLKQVKGAPILPPVMILADQKGRTALEKANNFNKYFISVYKPRGTCKTENLQYSLVCDFGTSPENVCVVLRELDVTK